MIDKNIRGLLLFACTLGFITGSPAINAKAPRSSNHSAIRSEVQEADRAAIKAQIVSLTKALANGDAFEVSRIWTNDGTYINEDGNLCKGREELIKHFSRVFKESGKPIVELSPEDVHLLSPTVGYAEGTVRQNASTKDSKDAAEDQPADTRYTMIFVKENKNWLIANATETPIANEDNAQPAKLEDLSWLIGKWKAERNGASVHLNAEWANDKNFIHCQYEIVKPDHTKGTDIQVIGLDPKTGQLVSWNFNSTGGNGTGTWFKHDKKWIVESTGIERNGSVSRATNIIESTEPSSFLWQSLNRSVNGVAIADSNALKVDRESE
jgi:uncharacterized protein (TIGR02246 family)